MHPPRTIAALCLLLTGTSLSAATASASQTLQVNISPAASFSTSSYSFTLTKSGSLFISSGRFTGYTANLTLLYHARTGAASTTAGITVKATSDFAPAGGPAIASGPVLTYTCAGPTLGTGCTGVQTVSTVSATRVVTLPAMACTGGGSPCSNGAPNSATMSFFIPDDPKYRTGFYTTNLQFTISGI